MALIAAVLLIAFTMAIATFMATWAQSLTETGLGSTECALALAVEDLEFENGNITVAIRNKNNKINLTDFVGSVYYSDAVKNKDYVLSEYGADDPLAPLMGTTAVINTGDATKPERIMVIAGNCPNAPAFGYF